MKITLNGEERDVGADLTLESLVDSLDLRGRPIAIELNREIVPRNRFAQVSLRDGDRLEVVTFVGGG